MLDQETKKRIDNACNILVGKVPTPLAQVEQITLALIYKFMNDMDRRAEAMGGKASYFVGDQEKYSWDNLMDTRLGGRERADLYEEGLAGLSLNASLPDLFRNIFKEASVPYKDPRTLNLFLQEINGFSYEDSENLGDAYEYLLGKTGSQGEAGQFRTPRHIIDFIVQVVDPGKHDTILDPACGTAGFLISAIKHIYKTNTREIEGDMLSTREIMGLSNNVFGYDITPDMVRISRVNMFLHNINQPHIYEYDTLSSLEKWDDNFSCILANPPFMTPKGGVVPHNRFSIKSSRSEVLFVDYMLEHLTVDGKAGIIVPEGIIFKSDKACKQLRKKLVEENYLAGVISLPAGVFNPYSGVKTSILWIDRTLAKKANKIIFLKIDADGFDLGANRRPIEANDLPAAIASALAFKQAVFSGNEFQVPDNGVILVDKANLAESRDYNLSGERFVLPSQINTEFPVIALRDIVTLIRGVTYTKEDEVSDEGMPVLRANNINLDGELDLNEIKLISKNMKFKDSQMLKKGDIFICLSSGSKSHVGKVAYIDSDTDYFFGGFMGAIRVSDGNILPKYLFHLLRQDRFNEYLRTAISGANINNLSASILYNYQIPLPPLSVQEEIITELDSYQKIIDGARQVVDNWKPQINIDSEWVMYPLKDIAVINPQKSEVYGLPERMEVSFVPMRDLGINEMYLSPLESKPIGDLIKGSYTFFRDNDVILAKVTPCFENGKAGIAKGLTNGIGFGSSEYYIFRCSESVLPQWAYFCLISPGFRSLAISNMTGTGGLQRIPKDFVKNFEIPVPDIKTQHAIVSSFESEQKLVDANRQLITIYEQKIKDRIDRLWSEKEVFN